MAKYKTTTIGADGTITNKTETWDGAERDEDGRDMNAVLIIALRLSRIHQAPYIRLIEMVSSASCYMGRQTAFCDDNCTIVVTEIG